MIDEIKDYGDTSVYAALKTAMEEDGESFVDKICFVTDEQLKSQSAYSSGTSFPVAWGKDWVYFMLMYDGGYWYGHAPRNPTDAILEGQGGGG